MWRRSSVTEAPGKQQSKTREAYPTGNKVKPPLRHACNKLHVTSQGWAASGLNKWMEGQVDQLLVDLGDSEARGAVLERDKTVCEWKSI